MFIPAVLFLVGMTFVYGAVKNLDPRDVIMNVLRGEAPDAEGRSLGQPYDPNVTSGLLLGKGPDKGVKPPKGGTSGDVTHDMLNRVNGVHTNPQKPYNPKHSTPFDKWFHGNATE